MQVSKQIKNNQSLKQVQEFATANNLTTLKHSTRGHSKTFIAGNTDTLLTWYSQSRTMILLKADEQIVADNFRDAFNDGEYHALELINEEMRSYNTELNAFKSIVEKGKATGNKIKFTTRSSGALFEMLKSQTDSTIKHGLFIHEKYTNCMWFIYQIYNNGTAMCYANLNNPDFAEFGSVTFSEIDNAYFGDDNNFTVKVLKKKDGSNFTTKEISDFCRPNIYNSNIEQ